MTCAQSVPVIFGIAVIYRARAPGNLGEASRESEIAVFKEDIFHYLLGRLTDSHDLADILCIAERIGAVKAHIAEGDILYAAFADGRTAARQSVSRAHSDVYRRTDIRHIYALKSDIFDFSAVHRLKRDAATVDILYRAVGNMCIFQTIIGVSAEICSLEVFTLIPNLIPEARL